MKSRFEPHESTGILFSRGTWEVPPSLCSRAPGRCATREQLQVDSLGSKDRRQNKRGGKACKRSARTAGLTAPKYQGLGAAIAAADFGRPGPGLHSESQNAVLQARCREHASEAHLTRDINSRPDNYKHPSWRQWALGHGDTLACSYFRLSASSALDLMDHHHNHHWKNG
jgi:hypothetical protein